MAAETAKSCYNVREKNLKKEEKISAFFFFFLSVSVFRSGVSLLSILAENFHVIISVVTFANANLNSRPLRRRYGNESWAKDSQR